MATYTAAALDKVSGFIYQLNFFRTVTRFIILLIEVPVFCRSFTKTRLLEAQYAWRRTRHSVTFSSLQSD